MLVKPSYTDLQAVWCSIYWTYVQINIAVFYAALLWLVAVLPWSIYSVHVIMCSWPRLKEMNEIIGNFRPFSIVNYLMMLLVLPSHLVIFTYKRKPWKFQTIEPAQRCVRTLFEVFNCRYTPGCKYLTLVISLIDQCVVATRWLKLPKI